MTPSPFLLHEGSFLLSLSPFVSPYVEIPPGLIGLSLSLSLSLSISLATQLNTPLLKYFWINSTFQGEKKVKISLIAEPFRFTF